VYLQQCGYVLSDAQNVHNAMQMMLRTVKNLALDLDAGKARYTLHFTVYSPFTDACQT
jgi:meiotic recombination protein REC8